MPLTRKESLIVIADSIEGFWLDLARSSGAEDLDRLAKDDAKRLREIAATLPDQDPAP